MTKDGKRLRELSAGIDRILPKDWARLQKVYKEKRGEGIQLRSRELIANLRARGILDFLIHARRDGFFKASYQAGLVYENCNRLIKAGMPHEPNLYTFTRTRGLFDAFLTFPRPDILRMLSTAPDEMQDEDDAIPFLFHTFLAEQLEGKNQGAEETLESLREEAAEEDVGVEVGLCEALRDRHKGRFLEGVVAFLNRRQEQIKSREDVLLGEEFISIEGLALRRIGALLGIDVQIRHELTPLELQEDNPEVPPFSADESANLTTPTPDTPNWAGWQEVTPW